MKWREGKNENTRSARVINPRLLTGAAHFSTPHLATCGAPQWNTTHCVPERTPPPPLCHPLDSFPYASFPCWSFTDSSKCTTQPSGSLDLLYVQSVTPRNTPHSFSQIRDFRFHTIVAKHRLLNQYLCDCCKQKDSSLILPNTTEQHVAKKKKTGLCLDEVVHLAVGRYCKCGNSQKEGIIIFASHFLFLLKIKL